MKQTSAAKQAPVTPKQQRGLDRRRALIEAGTRILDTVGPGDFSARRVAAEAGVPLAAVTYYFESVEELLGLATDRVVAGWLAHGHRVATDSAPAGDIAAVATTLTFALLPQPDSTVPGAPTVDEQRRSLQSRYEQLLSAGRSPTVSVALRTVRPALYELIESITARADTPIRLTPATILAIIDGAAVGAISENAPDPVAFIIGILTEALHV